MFSGLPPERVIGRNFFTDVAPCTNNFMVADKLRDAAELDESVSYSFSVRMRPTPVTLRPQRGFTLPELVAVLLLVGILSATALPKLNGALSFRDDGWRDQVVAVLHHAHKSAVSHRRLVCASVAAANVTLSIAAANPATGCNVALPGVDGQAKAADSQGAGAASISPPGPLYFQPSGRVTSDGAGLNASTRTIVITGQAAVALVGETGHVE